MALVVALRLQSAPIERQDRIEEMPATVAAVGLVEARRAGDQRRPAAQEFADRRQRRAVARSKKGKADSGQIRWVTSATLEVVGEVARSDRARYS